MRLMTGAPWYVRNSTLHNDLNIPTVKATIRRKYESLRKGMLGHNNPIIAAIPEAPSASPEDLREKDSTIP